jgi:hypothetical protein
MTDTPQRMTPQATRQDLPTGGGRKALPLA